MHCCIISLAANCNQKKNLAEARLRLSQILFNTQYTKELWTAPVGSAHLQQPSAPVTTHSDCQYLNQLVYAQTELSCSELERALKATECAMGRSDADRRQGIVRIDLDLLRYDETLHHLQDWSRAYIKDLLSEEVEHQ